MGLIDDRNCAPFSTGAAKYEIGPARRSGKSDRFLVQVDIAGHKTQAFVDTGAPFSGIVTMETEFVSNLNEKPIQHSLSVRGVTVAGELHRLPITIEASQGDNLVVESTVFLATGNWLHDFRPFLGLSNLLDSIRFAFDPFEEVMYFGKPPS